MQSLATRAMFLSRFLGVRVLPPSVPRESVGRPAGVTLVRVGTTCLCGWVVVSSRPTKLVTCPANKCLPPRFRCDDVHTYVRTYDVHVGYEHICLVGCFSHRNLRTTAVLETYGLFRTPAECLPLIFSLRWRMLVHVRIHYITHECSYEYYLVFVYFSTSDKRLKPTTAARRSG